MAVNEKVLINVIDIIVSFGYVYMFLMIVIISLRNGGCILP